MAGVRVGVCEMPRVGDGTLVAALARQSVTQVPARAPDAEAVAIARKPSADAHVMGPQNIIETGSPSAVPLTDWVADLYVVADATDDELVEIHGFLPSRRLISRSKSEGDKGFQEPLSGHVGG